MVRVGGWVGGHLAGDPEPQEPHFTRTARRWSPSGVRLETHPRSSSNEFESWLLCAYLTLLLYLCVVRLQFRVDERLHACIEPHPFLAKMIPPAALA